MKQTAVELIHFGMLGILGDDIVNNLTLEKIMSIHSLTEQAKKTEEQEKVEFALKAYLGTFNSDKSFNDMVDSMRTFKQQEQ